MYSSGDSIIINEADSNGDTQELNKILIFAEELADVILKPDHPLRAYNLRFCTPVVHQQNLAGPSEPGYLKIGGRREETLFDLIIECMKEICERVLPENGENLFSRIKGKLQEPASEKVLKIVIDLWKDKSSGMNKNLNLIISPFHILIFKLKYKPK